MIQRTTLFIVGFCVICPLFSARSQRLSGVFSFFQPSKDDSARIVVYGDAAIKSLISDANTDKSSATGSLAIYMKKSGSRWNAAINIASNDEVMSSDYASLILNPSTGKVIRSGILEYSHATGMGFILPDYTNVYLSASTAKWASAADTSFATVVGLGLLGAYHILPEAVKLGETEVGLGFDGGLSFRHITGNVVSDMKKFSRMLSTNKTLLIGLEAGLHIQINSVVATLRGYYYFNAYEIAGMTGLQLTGGLSISAPILKGVVGLTGK
jgi:hypothetical protein